MRQSSVALAATALALLAASPASAAEKAIWGPVKLPGGGSAFPTYRDLGVDTFQYVVNWDDVAPDRPAEPGDPNDPVYRWPRAVDEAVDAAARQRINVALQVIGSPPWANGGQSRRHTPNSSDFATFMAAASRRYPSVRRWMVWGEPNRADRFQPNAENSPVGPRAYAQVLDAAYASLKAVSSSNIVIGGMTWTGGDVKPAQFMKFMRLPNGRPPRLDWYGHNPFPFRFPNLSELALREGFRDISDLDSFQGQLRRTYGRRARFWLSEFLVLSERKSDQFESFVSRAQQARWLSAAFGIADRLESVAGIGWLSLLDEPQREGSSNWGLLTDDGQRKPAYNAYRDARGERFRPMVTAPRRVRRSAVAAGRLRVLVRPRASGRVSVELRRGKRRVALAARTMRAGKAASFRLGGRRARRGRYLVVVRAARGATVRRKLTVE